MILTVMNSWIITPIVQPTRQKQANEYNKAKQHPQAMSKKTIYRMQKKIFAKFISDKGLP